MSPPPSVWIAIYFAFRFLTTSLRAIWSGHPKRGAVSAKHERCRTVGGVSKKSVFARTSLMDDPKC